MLNDGHSGSRFDLLDTIDLQDFDLRLALLHQVDGSARFVVHIHPRTYNRGGLSPADFLYSLGLHHESRGCPFFEDGCLYDDGTLVRQLPAGANYANETEGVKLWFRRLADQLPLLYVVRMREEDLLKAIGRPLPTRYDFPSDVEIRYVEDDEPLWVDEAAFGIMRQAKASLRAAAAEWDRWNILNRLLYGTGMSLEEAVVHALHLLGLRADRTEPSATIDVYAETLNRQHTFGIEVTGINGAVKKDSKKLTQLSEFDRIKDGDEKPMLIAATFNDRPVDQRRHDDFTPQVVDYFSGRNVLLMTGLDLFRLCGKVADGEITAERSVGQLALQQGRFDITIV